MAEKDIAEKTLESFNDVFADIMNNLLFQGEQRVHEEDLIQGMLDLRKRCVIYMRY